MSTTTTMASNIESLILVTSRLIGVLNHEVEMLRAMRISDIEKLQDEKTTLTLAYENCVRALQADPAALAAVGPAVRRELDLLAQRFDEALSSNARALNAVRESHDRLLAAIVDAVASKRASQKGYGANGAFDRSRGNRTAPVISLSLDQRL
jgi:hypothetical protein